MRVLEKEMNARMKREGLHYCGNFKHLIYGWCGMTKSGWFGNAGGVFMCNHCIIKNLKKCAFHAISETGGKE